MASLRLFPRKILLLTLGSSTGMHQRRISLILSPRTMFHGFQKTKWRDAWAAATTDSQWGRHAILLPGRNAKLKTARGTKNTTVLGTKTLDKYLIC